MSSEKQKVLFYGFRKTLYPPLGIAYIVSNLRRHGFDYEYKYIEAIEDIQCAGEELVRQKPDILGFTACSADFIKVKKISKYVKENSNTMILMGGSHISSVPQTMPREIDIGFLGEAEETIVEIFLLLSKGQCNVENLRKIKSVVFYDEDGHLQINERRPYVKDLDRLPMPARDIFVEDYWKRGSTSLLTSRGCPFNCAYCQITTEWKVCRYHSANYVVEEMKEMHEKYNINVFGIIDDLFIAHKKRIAEIIQRMKEEGILGQIQFAVNGRSNLINEEIVELLKQMGVIRIGLGIETMSPKILPTLKDKVTVEDNKRAVDTIYKSGIKSGGFFMVGSPSETLEDMELSYNYAKNNRHKFGGMQVCVTTPLPNTPLWDLCLQRGLLDKDINKLNWEKLNMAAEDIRTNLYVGDLDIYTFMNILRKFYKLCYHPLDVELEFPQGDELLYDSKINLKNEILFNPESSEINPNSFFQEGGISADLQRVEHDGKRFYRLKDCTWYLAGLFNTITISYKTNVSRSSEELAEIIVEKKRIPLQSTEGELKEIKVQIHDGKLRRKKGIGTVHLKLKNKDVDVLIEKIKVDFTVYDCNYIKAGCNEMLQIDSAIYPTEISWQKRVFWTNGRVEGKLVPVGNENAFCLDFYSGQKKDQDENILVKVKLFDDECNTIIFSDEIYVEQAAWNSIVFLHVPCMNKLKRVPFVVESDYFSPIELGISKDFRKLGIFIEKLALIKMETKKDLCNEDSFVKAGVNETRQVEVGAYPTEKLADDYVFWTDGRMEGLLKLQGNESGILLEFFAGRKRDPKKEYRVKIKLVNVNDRTIIYEKEVMVEQFKWHKLAFTDVFRPGHIGEFRVIIESDFFSSHKLGESCDTRRLGIAIREIALLPSIIKGTKDHSSK